MDLKQTALKKSLELGVMTPTITDYAREKEGERGFFVDMKGANLNLSKSVHAAIQQQAIESNERVWTRLFPGRIQVYWKR